MALDAMSGFDIAGRPSESQTAGAPGRVDNSVLVRVSTVQERAYVAEQIEDSGYGTRLDATQRQQLMYKLARTEPNVNLALSAPKSGAPAPSVFIFVTVIS